MVNRVKESTKKLGQLRLPLPSSRARVESVDGMGGLGSGSLLVVDELTLDELTEFRVDVARMIAFEECDRPAKIWLRTGGEDITVHVPSDLGPKAVSTFFYGCTELDPTGKVEAVGWSLACGCGVKITVRR